MRSFHATLKVLCCVVVVLGVFTPSLDAQLDPSFYRNTCPRVHSIVREVVREVSKKDPRMLASLIRLHFHDCFVQVRIYTYIHTLQLSTTLFSLFLFTFFSVFLFSQAIIYFCTYFFGSSTYICETLFRQTRT